MKIITLSLIAFLSFSSTLFADPVPQIINYQGRVVVGSVNFDGSGQFKFALVNAGGTVTHWSNDGTSTGGSEPTAAVTRPVTKGLYSIQLGDTTLANMTAVPTSVFDNADVRLRVWFNDGTNGSQLLTPDQRITSAGYAMKAGSADTVADGSVTSAKLASGLTMDSPTFTGTVNAQNANFSGNLNVGSTFFAPTRGGNTGAINLFVGNAGHLNSTGHSNIFIGEAAGQYNTTGTNNTAVGVFALNSCDSNFENVALGESSLRSCTSNRNTAVGIQALGNGTLGGYNTGLGYQAGIDLTTGANNIVIGHRGLAADDGIIRIGTPGTQTDTYLTGVIHGDGAALTNLNAANLTGALPAVSGANLTNLNASNIVSGTLADSHLTSNVALLNSANAFTGNLSVSNAFIVQPRPSNTGAFTIFAGNNAGASNTTGIQNTFMGSNAGLANTTGGGNAFFGTASGQANSTGSSVTFIGNFAGVSNTTGNSNTFVGAGAGQNNTTGSSNIALGQVAGTNLTTGSNNIMIGNAGVAGESAIIRIGNAQTDTYLAGVVHGNGSGLTNLNAASITGTIPDANLATISTAGKVANSATTATSTNTPGTIVARDASGDFAAGTITATAFSGNGSGLTNIVKTVSNSISITPSTFDASFLTGGVALGTGPTGAPCISFPDGVTADAKFTVILPDDFNFATHQIKVYYTSTTTTGNFDCSLFSRGTAPGATMLSSGGGAFTTIMTGQATTSTLGMGITDALGQMDTTARVVNFMLRRRGGNAGDTSTGSLQIYGIAIQWTNN